MCTFSLRTLISSIGWICLCNTAAGQQNDYSYSFEPATFNNRLFQHTVSGLVKDEWGMLWALTQFGCYRFDGYNTEVYTTNNVPWLTSDRYRDIFKDRNRNQLLVAGENEFFFVQDGKLVYRQYTDSVLVISKYNHIITHKNRLANNQEFRNEKIFDAALLFTSTDTIIVKNGKGFSLNSGRYIPYDDIQSIEPSGMISRSGNQYLLQHNGLYKIAWKNGTITRELINKHQGFTHIIPCVEDDAIWIENDLIVRKIQLPDGKITREFIKPKDYKFSPAVLEDEETGLIYLGSDKKGVLTVRSTPLKVLAPDIYNHSYAFNQTAMAYMIPTNKGIASFSMNNGITTYDNSKNDLRNISIFTDKQERVWFQTNKEITWIMDHSLKKTISKITDMDLLISVEQIDDNHFIIADHYQIYEYDLGTKSRSIFYTVAKNERINDFTTKDGLIYISSSNGLHILNMKDQTVKHLLEGTHVRKTIIWKDGTMVIGTYGKGVFIQKNNKIYAPPTKNHPQLGAVVNLVKDNDSALWVICNKAAYIWNDPRLSNEMLDEPDHILYVGKDLPCNELNGGLTPDVFPNGHIVLPSSDGLLILKKEDIIKPFSQYKVGISKIQVDDSLILEQTGFAIPAGNHQLRFHINAANLDDHRDYIPSYRIRGLDSQWQSLPQHRKIELNRMPSGTYHLEIKKNDTDKPVILSTFTVRPFWHETIWARILMAISAIGMIYFIVKFRIRSIKAQNVKLERIIDEKTKSLKENIKKLDISEQNLRKQYTYRNKLYSILVHDLKSPLSFLADYSSRQLAQNEQIETETLRTIAKSSIELSTYVNEFLYWLGNQYSPENIQISSTNISALLVEVTDFYQNVATINQNRLFFFDRHKNIYFPTDVNRLKIVIRNLLDNANKYTIKGIIKISHGMDEAGSLIITIEDSGKGLPESIIHIIHDQSNSHQIAPKINANYKMGLMISKELVEQLGGKIAVLSNEKMGTTFTLKFTATQVINAG